MSNSQAFLDKDKLREKRIKARLTRPALARLAGLHYDYIFKLEAGQRNASEISRGKLADALGCAETELMPDIAA